MTQELYCPELWPTVIKGVKFSLRNPESADRYEVMKQSIWGWKSKKLWCGRETVKVIEKGFWGWAQWGYGNGLVTMPWKAEFDDSGEAKVITMAEVAQ